MQQTEQAKSESVQLTCGEMLESPPSISTGVTLDDFVLGRHIAHRDLDGNGEWDVVAIPLFPKQRQKYKYGYRAVIVCCRGMSGQQQVDQQFINQAVDTHYWPGRQELDSDLYSDLAADYRSLDFAASPIVFIGYDEANPVLGETSYQLSLSVGAISVIVAVLAFLLAVVSKLFKKLFKKKPQIQPVLNRAGLPPSVEQPQYTGGILDQVTSMREQRPLT